MKIIAKILVAFCIITNMMALDYDPLLVVVLMVKNEEAVIVQTLEPFVQAGVRSYLIFDTGSTDKTIQKVHDYFRLMGIYDYIVEQEKFIEFATSRNHALDWADYYFPRAAFYIMPDAEWYIDDAKKLLAFCQKELDQGPGAEVYAIRARNFNTEFDTTRLFKADKKIRFKGGVHECPVTHQLIQRAPDDIFFHWLPSDDGNDKTRKRTDRDIALLLQDYLHDPLDPRALFYLGQTHCMRGEYAKALFYFRQRIQLEGFSEEKFIAYYRIAQITEQLAYQGKESWGHALEFYLHAFSYRPTRAEPLIHVANYYLNNNCLDLALLFIQKALSIGYPTDSLFINKELFDFEQYRIFAACAYALGYYDEAKKAAERALVARPTDESCRKIVQAVSLPRAA